MAPTTFHLFPSLPLELRQEIYMLATPPRIVHIQECVEDDYEDFAEHLRTKPIQFKLHSSLAHFAFVWRRFIPTEISQPTLESFGFSGGKPPHQPWNPSTYTPAIPLNWLGERPREAWELTRRGYLYSCALIPALLHTCAESRVALMRRGYQLAFQTRSSEPRTWFNFDRDILFLQFGDKEYEGHHRFISNCQWDIGQLDPKDMKRVRKVALERSAHLCQPHIPPSYVHGSSDDLSVPVRLFGGLTELLLVEWTEKQIREFSDLSRVPCVGSTMQEAWKCMAVEEVDTFLSLFPPEWSWRPSLCSTGDLGEFLSSHKQENGHSAHFYKDMQVRIEQQLANYRDFTVTANTDECVTPWGIPKITAVHILSPSMCKVLSEERLQAVKRLRRLKTNWAATIRSETASAMPSSDWQDNDVEFSESPEPRAFCCNQCAEDFEEMRWINEEKKWWIREGPFLEVRHNYLY